MNEFGLDELNELLKEKIKIEKIRLIDVNILIKNSKK